MTTGKDIIDYLADYSTKYSKNAGVNPDVKGGGMGMYAMPLIQMVFRNKDNDPAVAALEKYQNGQKLTPEEVKILNEGATKQILSNVVAASTMGEGSKSENTFYNNAKNSGKIAGDQPLYNPTKAVEADYNSYKYMLDHPEMADKSLMEELRKMYPNDPRFTQHLQDFANNMQRVSPIYPEAIRNVKPERITTVLSENGGPMQTVKGVPNAVQLEQQGVNSIADKAYEDVGYKATNDYMKAIDTAKSLYAKAMQEGDKITAANMTDKISRILSMLNRGVK